MSDIKFSFKNLTPSIGEFIRKPQGSTTYYEVADFKDGSKLHTYAKASGGLINVEAFHILASRSPDVVGKIVKVTVMKPAKGEFLQE